MISTLGMQKKLAYNLTTVSNDWYRFYNKSKYSGLEIHISNSYANSLLQMMHFIPLVRNVAFRHAATSCVSEICLLCELGFLFDMLQKAEGSICQATNMLKTLSNHPQGSCSICHSRIIANSRSWATRSPWRGPPWIFAEYDASGTHKIPFGKDCTRL